MATLSTTRNYDDGQVLVRADLDAFLDDIETFLNVTKISDDNIQNSGITGSTKLLNASVTSLKLAANAVETAKILDAAVTNAKMATDSVATVNIIDSNVTTAKIADLAVTTAKINDAAVTTTKIANDGVQTVNILNSNVTTAKINDSAVTTAKINDGAVTPAKHSANYQSNTLTGSGSGSTTSYVQGTAIAVGGRPVLVVISSGTVAGASGHEVVVSRFDTNASTHQDLLTIASASNPSYDFGNLKSGAIAGADGGPISFVDLAPTGTYKYELKLIGAGASGTNVKITVYEL